MIDDEKFNKVRNKAEEEYKTIVEVHCPFLNAKVVFNAKGLEHIKFKKRDKARVRQDQYMRLRLLPIAPKILKASHTLQGFCATRNFEYEKSNRRWEYVLKNVCYFEFVAVANHSRMKIVVKQVEDGPFFFWSIIPFWKMNKQKTRILHTGDPEHD
ncbi:MAG: hypothetical protein ABII18_09780 [bacterium]